MIVICVAWAGFAFLFYRGIYVAKKRQRFFAVCADATFKAVSEHYDELKAKSKSLVIDKGYGVFDTSQWEEEVKRFTSEIVVNYIGRAKLNELKRDPWGSSLFGSISYRLVMDLMTLDKLPDRYELNELIASVEAEPDALSFLQGVPKFKPGMEVMTRLAMLLVVAGLAAGADKSMAAEGAPFSPIDACNALVDEDGFQPGKSGYSELSEGTYSCATPYKDLSDGVMPNNIALYARGRPDEVTRVKLMLNVNEHKHATSDTKTLAGLCEKLVAMMAGSAPVDLKAKVQTGKPFKAEFSGYNVFLDKTVWPTGKGYELNCGIATKDHKE